MSLKRNKQNIKNPITQFIKTFSIGSAVFIALIAASSLLIMNIKMQDKFLCVLVFIASALSALFTGLFATASIKQNRLLFGMINVVIETVIHFLVLLCFNNADLSAKIYLIFPFSLLSGLIGAILGIKIKK